MTRAFAKYLGPVAYGISIPLLAAAAVTDDRDLGGLGGFFLGIGAAWYLGRRAEQDRKQETRFDPAEHGWR